MNDNFMQTLWYNYPDTARRPRKVLYKMLTEVLYIGEKLRRLRKRALMSQRELARRSGVGVTTIVRIERNQVEPHGRTIRKLAEALNVEPHVLVEGADDA
jgi:DNA-binding XRE family transcriptional regulator